MAKNPKSMTTKIRILVVRDRRGRYSVRGGSQIDKDCAYQEEGVDLIADCDEDGYRDPRLDLFEIDLATARSLSLMDDAQDELAKQDNLT